MMPSTYPSTDLQQPVAVSVTDQKLTDDEEVSIGNAFPFMTNTTRMLILSPGARFARLAVVSSAAPLLTIYGITCKLHRPSFNGGAVFSVMGCFAVFLWWKWYQITLVRAESLIEKPNADARYGVDDEAASYMIALESTDLSSMSPRSRGLHDREIQAAYDFFLSYRVDSDREVAKDLYTELKLRGHNVFLDSVCLKFGEDWRVGFLDGLHRSEIVVLLISDQAIRRFQDIEASTTRTDNVLLEYNEALDRQNDGKKVLPIFLGDTNLGKNFSLWNLEDYPEVVPPGLEDKIQPRTVRETMRQLFQLQGVMCPDRTINNHIQKLEVTLKEMQGSQQGFSALSTSARMDEVFTLLWGVASSANEPEQIDFYIITPGHKDTELESIASDLTRVLRNEGHSVNNQPDRLKNTTSWLLSYNTLLPQARVIVVLVNEVTIRTFSSLSPSLQTTPRDLTRTLPSPAEVVAKWSQNRQLMEYNKILDMQREDGFNKRLVVTLATGDLKSRLEKAGAAAATKMTKGLPDVIPTGLAGSPRNVQQILAQILGDGGTTRLRLMHDLKAETRALLRARKGLDDDLPTVNDDNAIEEAVALRVKQRLATMQQNVKYMMVYGIGVWAFCTMTAMFFAFYTTHWLFKTFEEDSNSWPVWMSFLMYCTTMIGAILCSFGQLTWMVNLALFYMDSWINALLGSRFVWMLESARVCLRNDDVYDRNYLLLLSSFKSMSADWCTMLPCTLFFPLTVLTATLHEVFFVHPDYYPKFYKVFHVISMIQIYVVSWYPLVDFRMEFSTSTALLVDQALHDSTYQNLKHLDFAALMKRHSKLPHQHMWFVLENMKITRTRARYLAALYLLCVVVLLKIDQHCQHGMINRCIGQTATNSSISYHGPY